MGGPMPAQGSSGQGQGQQKGRFDKSIDSFKQQASSGQYSSEIDDDPGGGGIKNQFIELMRNA